MFIFASTVSDIVCAASVLLLVSVVFPLKISFDVVSAAAVNYAATHLKSSFSISSPFSYRQPSLFQQLHPLFVPSSSAACSAAADATVASEFAQPDAIVERA